MNRDYRRGMHSVDHIDPGDADLSVIGAALAGKGRGKILRALADGRALPASVLAGEAGANSAKSNCCTCCPRAAGVTPSWPAMRSAS